MFLVEINKRIYMQQLSSKKLQRSFWDTTKNKTVTNAPSVYIYVCIYTHTLLFSISNFQLPETSWYELIKLQILSDGKKKKNLKPTLVIENRLFLNSLSTWVVTDEQCLAGAPGFSFKSVWCCTITVRAAGKRQFQIQGNFFFLLFYLFFRFSS